MLRWQLIVALPIALSGCQLFQTPAPEAPVVVEAPVCPAPPEPEACPEPVEIVKECPVIAEAAPIPAPVIKKPVPQKPTAPARMGSNQLLVIGVAENVTLDPPGVKVKARIDTGAETSSLHASNIIPFERDGERWVRFEFSPNDDAETVTIERPLSRKVKIKRHDADSTRRRVVEMRVRLGDIDEEIEVTLTDRSEFSFPMLIGRNFLTDNAVVDVSKSFNIR
ncbi:hypothetical protein R50072_29020 [Simiduia litorea]|uniref:ATP-dependent zinc protease family protein n=1 Tax=Simiduia litorea TaxID=1435348 RepID=UPI0036F31F43